jgi:geranylgeranyl diphosphate synthase type I
MTPTSHEASFYAVSRRYGGAIERAMRRAVGARRDGPGLLMRYHFGWSDARGRAASTGRGKLLRPLLCLLACEAVGGNWRQTVPAAVAIELLHNFTLIHDDIEDASALRHGRPTVWRVWGPELAINAGDGMFALAHVELLRLDRSDVPSEPLLSAMRLLDETTLTLCEGQHRDLSVSDGDTLTPAGYTRLVEGKTAALLAASANVGALLGGATRPVAVRFGEYGRKLGMAFQVRDDMLGIWGSEATTGKSAADDLRAGKQTYPIVHARTRASATERRALDRLLVRATKDLRAAREARAALERLGAREASERAARRHARSAIDSLPKRGIVPERARELEALALFAAERDR